MTRYILILCCALTSLGTMAQSPFSFQVKASIGTSNFGGKDTETETKIACKAGAGMEYALSKTWALQAMLNFVSKGAKGEMGGVKNAKMNEYYLELPLMVAARLQLGKNYRASLMAGPYIAYGISGITSGESTEYGLDHNIHSDKGYLFRMRTFGHLADGCMGNKRWDTGISFGLSFEYYKLILGAEAQIGLVSVNDELSQVLDNQFAPKNRAIFFTAGYRLWN